MELKIKFSFNGNEVRQEERAYFEEKVEKMKKLLPSGKDKESIVEIGIKRDKKGFWELDFSLDSSYELYRATEKDRNLREAMDRIEEVIKKQLRRDKEKVFDLRRKGKREIKEEFVVDDQAKM
jgi:ribosome-associated translation inhibitor RaiA